MATATWEGLETVEGIIKGVIHPETLPFAKLSVDEQKDIIDRIDEIGDDVKAEVLKKYPDLNDEAQRNDRLRCYRAELLARTEDSLRDAYAGYFDTIMGACLRRGNTERSYTIDSCGCVSAA